MRDLLKAYRMYQKMMQYPHLMGEMRRLFLSALVERGIATPESIRKEALEADVQEVTPHDRESPRESTDALIDLYFAKHFSEEEIENYINLARKLDAFQKLNQVVNTEGAGSRKIKKALKEFTEIPQGNLYIPPSEAEGVRVALINHFISDQLPFVGIAKRHITIRDIDELLDSSFWNRRRSGKIGGKAAGMFLAYKIILPRLGERDPELERYVAIPESYYFNSGILSDFLDYNRLYALHSQKYKSRETIEEDYKHLADLLEKAVFPGDVVEDLRSFLDDIGEHPLVLRSSSLLEDNIGYAFSGKYESVFLANQGDIKERLNGFIRGLKRVLMSTLSPAAILYRRDHNLLDFDERMSVLVQKVVGRRFGDYHFPFAAGVAYSQNTYRWTPRIRKEEGFVRLVVGLGTRSVDRIEPDYPRLVALSHPSLRPEVGVGQVRKYSQKLVDVLNLRRRELETLSYMDLFKEIQHPDLYYALSIDEGGLLSSPLFKGQEIPLSRTCITMDNFLSKTPFVPIIRKVLNKLQSGYGRPVEVEFAWDNGKFYLLQCRSLALRRDVGRVIIPPDVPLQDIVFTNSAALTNSIIRNIEYIVYIIPTSYAQLMTYEERRTVGRIVSRMNRLLEGKRYALFGPSRWGSNDVNYGVKVGYEDINHTAILAEVAFEEEGITPEVSYGTHFFNDLVEAGIITLAIYPDHPGMLFREDFFLQCPNALASFAPDFASYAHVVRVIHVPSCTGGRLLHVLQDAEEQRGMGFLSHSSEDPL